MTDLIKLKEFGEKMVPIFEQIYDLPDLDTELTGGAEEEAAVSRLQKVIAEAHQPAAGDLLGRGEAVVAVKEALTEIIVLAGSKPDSIPKAKLRMVEAQHTVLGALFGRLLELSAFAAIPSLFNQDEIKAIEEDLKRAAQQIKQRQKATQYLDLLVDIALAGGKVASRLG